MAPTQDMMFFDKAVVGNGNMMFPLCLQMSLPKILVFSTLHIICTLEFKLKRNGAAYWWLEGHFGH